MAYQKITAQKRERINKLVEILYHFLPLTAHGKNAVTFRSIFAESNIEKYLDGPANKKQALQQAWIKIIRNHPKLPNILIRKIVPATIEYRRHQRNPLKRIELESLIEVLKELKISVWKELKKITLDESIPEIQVPPKTLVERLENHPLHDAIRSEPLQLFKDGHFNEAVRKACEKFEAEIQQRTGETEIGKSLMGKVFKLDNPIIKLNPLKTENEKGIQEGYMLLTMGLMRAVRNIFSHGDEPARHLKNPMKCFFL